MLTHKEPQHIEELARRIVELSPSSEIVVHHDLAAATEPWGGRAVDHVHMVERGRVRWGDWSMVEATLRLLRFAVEHLDADWFVLVSGEHRPIVALEQWQIAATRSGVDAFADATRLPLHLSFGDKEFEANQYLARSRHRWSTVPRPRSPIAHRAIGGLTKISRRAHPIFSMEYVHRRESWVVGLPRRSGCMRGRAFFRGSQWLAVNRRGADAMLHTDPVLTKRFQKSWIPDETYFQTVLHLSSDLIVSDQPTTYVLETPDRPTSGWMRLSLDDLPAAWASGAPFARKVDPVARPEVIAAIDRVVDEQRSADFTDSPQPLR
jgi:hypothetical protein